MKNEKDDYCKSAKISNKVLKSFKHTGLAEWNMSVSEVVEVLVSFCKDHPDEVKKWKEKNKEKFE